MNYKKLNIKSPTLVLDKKRCLNNIDRFCEKSKSGDVSFRPHFKTHQSHTVGRWFRDKGINRITVSSLKMAEYFAEDGWKDITLAFPVNMLEMENINSLAKKVKLNLLVSSGGSLKNTSNITENIYFYIEIDTGERRSGIKPENDESIKKIIDELKTNKNIKFEGFLTHSGHSYRARSKDEIMKVHNDSLDKMNMLKERYRSVNSALKISIGDTPTISVANIFKPADEIRPGNFVFYDWMQYKIGSCNPDDIALIAACPVVAAYANRNEAIIHGGAVHLSKDNIMNEDGRQNYGAGVYLTENGWRMPDNMIYLKRLSQEHGVLHVPDSERNYVKEESIIGIIPIHSCLTADCMGRYITEDGEMNEMMGK